MLDNFVGAKLVRADSALAVTDLLDPQPVEQYTAPLTDRIASPYHQRNKNQLNSIETPDEAHHKTLFTQQ